MSDNIFTPIKDLGEFNLINRLTKNFLPKNENILKAIGDDCAVVKQNDGKVQLFSTDMLIENVHFDLAYYPLKHLGYKAVAVNASDIYAMNGKPQMITVALGIHNRLSVEHIEQIYEGIKLACDFYEIDLLGGDISSSAVLTISVTIIGETTEEKVAYRNGAKLNDLVCVSGDLGSAFAGLNILEQEKAIFHQSQDIQPDLERFSHVVGKQIRPEARKEIVEFLESNSIKPTSMIDISDGLASELHHIASRSNVGMEIYEARLPIHDQTYQVTKMFKTYASSFVMNGGEDYELLFTIDLADFEKVKDVAEIAVIGKVVDKSHGIKLLMDSGVLVEIEPDSFEHF